MGVTSIEWCDRSVNPIRARLRDAAHAGLVKGGYNSGIGHYCELIGTDCANCYSSETQPRFGMPRFPGVKEGDPSVEIFFDESRLEEVGRRRIPTKFFWADMSDLFGRWVKNEWIYRCLDLAALTPHHIHQFLTKRPERMAMVAKAWSKEKQVSPPSNIWLGCSAGNQMVFNERVPHLERARLRRKMKRWRWVNSGRRTV